MSSFLSSRLCYIALLFFAVCCDLSISYRSGFWYGNTRPPELLYESLPYANLTVKVNQSYHDGPGQHLVTDPNNASRILYVGNTINRQTFDTQFILDLQYAIGIEPERVFVQYVDRGDVHYTWESSTVVVNFIFLERNNSDSKTLLECVAELTMQIQTPDSKLYHGTNVTVDIDPLWGLVEVTWDISLRLSYAIEVIGHHSVKDGYYLNQGSLGTCDTPESANHSEYCEFERFFEDDVSEALNISDYRVQILFIKTAALDSVVVYFRIAPPRGDQGWREDNITMAIANLQLQVADMTSPLYGGNVTLRTDSTWGVSNSLAAPRSRAALFTRTYYDYDPSRLRDPRRSSLLTPYDRCKANHRCNWGLAQLDQSTNDVRYFQRLFEHGTLYAADLFLDFEDWRLGSRGFSWSAHLPPTATGATSSPRVRAEDGTIRGAHFWPFAESSLGPDVPCYLDERNQGLVLDRQLQRAQIRRQQLLVEDLQGRIDWLEAHIDTAEMGPQRRSRKDVHSHLSAVRRVAQDWLDNEARELRDLSLSQCVSNASSSSSSCYLVFNTSALTLSGSIRGTGVSRRTAGGTEVALFTFNSIYLGPEVRVTVVGQRALALLSKTTATINTTIEVQPGTLGGFQGGGSVGRYEEDLLSDSPRIINICDLGQYCLREEDGGGSAGGGGGGGGDGQPTSLPTAQPSAAPSHLPAAPPLRVFSNNVNGPGSGNVRINAFVVRTQARHVPEVQTITTRAAAGQTLSGGFTVHFRDYSTPLIPHDVSGSVLRQILEDNLNLVPPASLPVYPLRTDRAPGIGRVSVSRSAPDPQQGYTWSVTFQSAIGDVPSLRVVSALWADGAHTSIETHTVVHGNELRGSFRLSFLNATTAPIAADETAAGLEAKLRDLAPVVAAFVQRTDPTGRCDDGLCPNGPAAARGLLWVCYVATDDRSDNLSPSSPTAAAARDEAPFPRVTATAQPSLHALDAHVDVLPGTALSPYLPQNLLNLSRPFSLAFGGGGGAYGGRGGAGYGLPPAARRYGDRQVRDLLGGSGGARAADDVFQLNAARASVGGYGGHGGGAVEIVAASDVVIGRFGVLRARGGDGEAGSGGGAGGGAGGAIVLAAGTVVHVQGTLDVRGGDGGFGGRRGGAQRAGGGGGGGRLALYGDAVVTTEATLLVDGGRCGVRKSVEEMAAVQVNASLTFSSPLPLSTDRLVHLAQLHLETWGIADAQISVLDLAVWEDALDGYSRATNTTPSSSSSPPPPFFADAYHRTQYFNVSFSLLFVDTDDVSSVSTRVSAALATGPSQPPIAELSALSTRVEGSGLRHVVQRRSSPTTPPCTTSGEAGTVYSEALMTSRLFVAETSAAEGTSRALFLSNREETHTSTGSPREVPLSWNGPTVSFEPSRPTRVTYYTRTDATSAEARKLGYGSLVSLVSRGEAGLAVSNVLGVYFGGSVMHGANFGSAVDETTFLKRLQVLDPSPELSRWYKVDLRLDWDAHTYSVSLDDQLVARAQPFEAEDVDGIRLSAWRAVDVWLDEVYVGFDTRLDFSCPVTTRRGTSTVAPVQRGWSFEEVHGGHSDGYTEYQTMRRHYNFLDTTGSIPFDGQGAVRDFQDIKLQFEEGDYPWTQGQIRAGSLVYLTDSVRSKRSPLVQSATLDSPRGLWYTGSDRFAGDGRHFWYSDFHPAAGSGGEARYYPALTGGVAACSSQDLNAWRFEGLVFHYVNITDMVRGATGPFRLERPKVLFNPATQEYVLWAAMDRLERDLAMNLVASSPFEDGPFLFRRSAFPDGNTTRDQVIFLNEEGVPLLARTYYQTVEYTLPQAIMQPVWEAAKSPSGEINYRSSYHRANYEVGYDNYHDIFLQRWRKENVEYEVYCEDKITGRRRRVPLGNTTTEGFLCKDPTERKIVVGQGFPAITSRFVSPNDTINSWWRPTSIPAVVAQDWSANYRDGYCGIRKLQDDFHPDDPNLADFEPASRATCSNIADNPIHATLQDKLIGVLRVVLTRRAKYLAISQLTEDYLDTTGYLTSFEGEFESGNLISLIMEKGQFGLRAGNSINSTFRPPQRSDFATAVDYRIRFAQYIRNYNDRASYSLACVLDGVCPVNFREQLTAGQD